MGRKVTVRIVGQEEEKYIKVRSKLTINNLKAIIKKEMKTINKQVTLKHKGIELVGNKRIEETRIEEGETIISI